MGAWFVALGCNSGSHAPPTLTGVEPPLGLLGRSTPVRLGAEAFPVRIESGVRGSRPVSVDATYSARIGGVPLEEVTWTSAQEVAGRVPATLSLGVHDLEVTDPWGGTARLVGAFTVVRPPVFLTIEDARAGEGSAWQRLDLEPREMAELFVALRDGEGAFLSSAAVDWAVDAGIASLSLSRGPHVVLTAVASGETSVVATLEALGLGAEVPLWVRGECQIDADCQTQCITSATCSGGLCTLGSPDKDSDGDGAVDAACIGGTDCDDDPAVCGAGCVPGNAALDLCDGYDQDCDGLTDEDYVDGPTQCGVGACVGNTGQGTCVAGVETNTCDPLAGASADLDCNGIDEDCDGVDFDGSCCDTDCTTCGSGCCSSVCLDRDCAVTCDGNCPCNYDCSGNNGSCSVTCTSGADCTTLCDTRNTCIGVCEANSVCNLALVNANTAVAICSTGSTCAVSCVNSNDCDVTCQDGSTCDIDCTGANRCEGISCEDTSSCMVVCTDASKCEFLSCPAGATLCPGDIIVCGRPCP